jgi:hypothetical protein
MLAVAAAALGAIVTSHEARAPIVSRYTTMTECSRVKHPPSDEDWVAFHCPGLANMATWYVCVDGEHCSYGFGTKPNATSSMLGIDRPRSWPVEWRGTVRNKHFEPTTVILRATEWIEHASSKLYVYRLLPDGTSCMVGEARSNAAARRLADQAATHYRCEDSSELIPQ